jgi:cytochrome bd-type quinol oxidase subunit 1
VINLLKRGKGAAAARRVPGLIASFLHVDAAVDAIRALRAKGYRNLVVYSPAPNHEIEEALDQGVSPVRGKPIASIPPYVVIGFELTILMGALSTVAAVALFSVLMGKRGVAYDPRFSDDMIGVFVPTAPEQVGPIEQLLRSAGAEEVRHESA